jgi:hypothetical protein
LEEEWDKVKNKASRYLFELTKYLERIKKKKSRENCRKCRKSYVEGGYL